MTYLPPEQRPHLLNQNPQAGPPQQYYVPAPQYPGPTPPGLRRRRKHPQAQLERFTWMDFATVLTYIAVMVVGLVGLFALLFVPQDVLRRNLDTVGFVLNFISYSICVVMVLISLKRELWKSFKTFLWYPWAKFPAVPGAWFVCIMLTAISITIFAELQGLSPDEITQSENQQAADSMMDAVSFVPMMLMVVLMGPLVEEYLFRHLLIGKLSGLLGRRLPRVARILNPWVLMVVSAFLFCALHFIGSGEMPTFITGTPYLLMGVSFGVGYLLSGKSIGFAYSMHAFSNLMALIVGYALGADLLGWSLVGA
ncbi:MAG: lysostaphin resistance A-like protein [Galactobacter sp.]